VKIIPATGVTWTRRDRILARLYVEWLRRLRRMPKNEPRDIRARRARYGVVREAVIRWPKLLLRERLIFVLPGSGTLELAEANLRDHWYQWVRETRCRFSVRAKPAVREALRLISVSPNVAAVAEAIPIIEDSELLVHAVRLDDAGTEHVSGRVLAGALRQDGALVPLRVCGKETQSLDSVKEPAHEATKTTEANDADDINLIAIVRELVEAGRARGIATDAAYDRLCHGGSRKAIAAKYSVTPEAIRHAERWLTAEAVRRIS